jgi:HEAT repeat protein
VAGARGPRPGPARRARGGADGPVALHFAARAAACGDGRDFIALGDHLTVNGSYRSVSSGWARRACVPGPARVTLTVRGGAVTAVRVRVGGGTPTDVAGARDLGAVGAPEAAAYFVALAGRAAGEVGERAVTAAALADSADVWRPLLGVARAPAADERTARAAMHWLGAVAPPEAVPVLAGVLRAPAERRAVREGAAVALAFAPDGAGVPALGAAARGEPGAGGGDPWVRDRAVFWLGNARDPRARATLRTLAAADTAPEAVRGQAIFTLGHIDRDDAGDTGNAAFLRALYPRLAPARLRDRAIQSVAQADDAASRRWLLDLAAADREPLAARKQALFWAGQQQDAPVDDLLAADARLAGAELRRHYAFVLSQRPEDAAVDQLVRIARSDADAGVRRQALFWLGQSRSPRARRYLEAVVAR